MEYNNLTVTPKSLINPDIPLTTPAGIAQLNMITIRIELKLRPIEFMALVDICGSRNVQLKQKKRTSLDALNADVGNLIKGKYLHDSSYPESLQTLPVIGLWEYECVAYFRGRSILSLTMGPTIRPLFPEAGVVDEEEIVMNRLLPSLYRHIFNDWFVVDQVIPISDIPVYDCGVADNSAATRYISNGLFTVDCMSLSEDDINTLKRTNQDVNTTPQLTMVVRSNIIDFIDIFAEHPTCLEILAYDPLCKKLANTIAGRKIDNEDKMLSANLIREDVQFTYVIRISFTETAIDMLNCYNWYKEGNVVFDEVQRLLYDLEIFK